MVPPNAKYAIYHEVTPSLSCETDIGYYWSLRCTCGLPYLHRLYNVKRDRKIILAREAVTVSKEAVVICINLLLRYLSGRPQKISVGVLCSPAEIPNLYPPPSPFESRSGILS
jgi:hypothetical protein